MKHASHFERQRNADFSRQGMQTVRPVERLVLRAVHRVEGADPKADGKAEHDHWRANRPAHGNPAPRRGHRDGDAQHAVAKKGHALHKRVNEERNRRQRQELDANGR